MLVLQSLPLLCLLYQSCSPWSQEGPELEGEESSLSPLFRQTAFNTRLAAHPRSRVAGSGAWSMTGQACPDPGHTKASLGGLCVSAWPIRQREGKAGVASSTSCQHTKFLSAFVLTEERTHSAENPLLSVGIVPSGRTHRKRAILLCANKHKLV